MLLKLFFLFFSVKIFRQTRRCLISDNEEEFYFILNTQEEEWMKLVIFRREKVKKKQSRILAKRHVLVEVLFQKISFVSSNHFLTPSFKQQQQKLHSSNHIAEKVPKTAT